MFRHVHRPAGDPRRKGRVRAILAGGIVLGVGATMTLASWTDQAFLNGVFGTGTFNILVSVNGTDYVEANASGSAASMVFTVAPNDMYPGKTVYAPVTLKTDATSVAANVTLQPGTNLAGDAGLFAALRYTVGATATCTAVGMTTATKIVDNTALTVGSAADAITLDAAGANPEAYCFAVTLPISEAANSALQGKTTTAQWEFRATSVTS